MNNFYPYLINIVSCRDIEEYVSSWMRSRISSRGRIWSYSSSHSVLEIRIEGEHFSDNIHIICKFCYNIVCPVLWEELDFHITDEGSGNIRLHSSGSEVVIWCSKIMIAQNVPSV